MAKYPVSLASTISLNDGVVMPYFGLGVYKAAGGEGLACENSVSFALRNNYRLLDTAAFYRNEKDVGRGLKKSGIDRKDVFVVTKLFWGDHGAKTKDAFHTSLKRLDLDYIDLYLIHSPSGGQILQTYDALLEIQKEGFIKSLGVSNFGVEHLRGLKEAGRPAPSVNQIELHPFQRKTDIVHYCRENNIAVMGWSPLAKGQKFDDPVLQKMAQKYAKSVAQVMIRWSVQNGYITIPKTVKEERIVSNAEVFDWSISDDDMKIMNDLPEFSCVQLTSKSWDEIA